MGQHILELFRRGVTDDIVGRFTTGSFFGAFLWIGRPSREHRAINGCLGRGLGPGILEVGIGLGIGLSPGLGLGLGIGRVFGVTITPVTVAFGIAVAIAVAVTGVTCVAVAVAVAVVGLLVNTKRVLLRVQTRYTATTICVLTGAFYHLLSYLLPTRDCENVLFAVFVKSKIPRILFSVLLHCS